MNQVSSKTSSLIRSNKKMIELVFLVLIVLNFAPFESLGSFGLQVKGMLGPIVNPVRALMANQFVRLLLWVVLVWSCCVMKDLNLFFILAIYFIIGN